MSLDVLSQTRPSESRRKAAIIVRLLRALDTDLSLSRLPEQSQLDLARMLGDMGTVDKDTVNTAIEEFTQALDSLALTATGGAAAALETLDGQLSPSVAAQVAEEAAQGNPEHAWTRLSRLPVPDLARIVQSESTEVAALMLSKLPVSLAARVMSEMPGDKARRVACTTSRIDDMPADAVARIAAALATEHCQTKPQIFDKQAVQRVGAILNSTERDRRDEVLTGLDEEDPEFGRRVRKEIFTFANIKQRVEPLDIPKLVRIPDQGQLTLAIAGALRGHSDDKAAAEFILENMSKRLAEQMREDAEAAPKTRQALINEAQEQLVKVIQDAAETGEIELIQEDDDSLA